jgi:hypothetical protein
MAYKTENLKEKAEKAIIDNELVFVEDVVAHLPCDKSTFYSHFPTESNEYNHLKGLLDDNKVATKLSLRKQWKKEEASPTLQLALYKLLSNEDELKSLSMEYREHSGHIDTDPPQNLDELYDAQAESES